MTENPATLHLVSPAAAIDTTSSGTEEKPLIDY